ncbi:hypothetical protein MAPG_03134 [Magnaporthiopsis poae ATCC 64411]|uniref:Uncharacterized protein n=1 Tax=Magnaporthiopsis poae (strain ATCC 64411 / 73-15) TaxID=644358 RepID=A0A0C4DT75_MAGP6|nr:hypothetical protein MAPG_03134 [Magnaporthiopsis poae ATCC 64411]
MPRATHPLTPASSTDLKSQDGSKQIAALQMSFELPPPALSAQAKASPPDSEPSPGQGQPKTLYPLQASETVKSRRRTSTLQSNAAPATTTKDSFALPPPPTRSRKIIQMKPRTQGEAEGQSSNKSGGGNPALQPLRDVDHEATAALLMLNSDRRGAANSSVVAGGGGGGDAGAASTGRGMSVRDLLST